MTEMPAEFAIWEGHCGIYEMDGQSYRVLSWGASKISEDGLSSAVHTVPIRMARDHTGAAGEGNQNSPA